MANSDPVSRKSRLTVPSGNDYVATPAASARAPRSKSTAAYLARLTDIRQMDIQSALDQMKTLLSTRPHVVYKTAYYRKQTKNHWARDDPAFCVLQAIFLLIATVAYSVAFRAPFSTALAFLLHSIVWNWLVCGVIVATVGREIASRHLTSHQSTTHVRQTVEWWYAFDIHCNAFFPLFCLLWGVQFFLLPLVLGKSLVAFVVSNTLYAAAFSWYWYITHLGYRGMAAFLSVLAELFRFPVPVTHTPFFFSSSLLVQYRSLSLSHCCRPSRLCS